MPISENITFERSEGGFPTLPDGTYNATVENVAEGTRNGYESGEQEPCLKFTFIVDEHDNQKIMVSKETSYSVHEKSFLYSILKALAGNAVKELIKDDKELIRFLNTCKGANVLIEVEKKVSKVGNEYNKIVSVIGLPGGQKQPKTEFEVDDIPF